jgi:hypothetical protein
MAAAANPHIKVEPLGISMSNWFCAMGIAKSN